MWKMNELADIIRKHNDLYYNQDNPEISDIEYDALVKELRLLDPNNPVFTEIGKPAYGTKFKHHSVMGSLSKCYTAEEIVKKFNNEELIFMPKIDGCSLSLHYENGKLIMAVTRGDGYEGEIVTENAKHVIDVPMTIDITTPVEVRGEAHIAKTDFYGIMDQRGYAGFVNGLANPRNAASGALRQKDPKLTAERKVRFVAYKLLNNGNTRQDLALEELRGIGFKIASYVIGFSNLATYRIKDIKSLELDYETDGVVIMLNDLKKFEEAGYSGKCPKGALAFKFDSEKKISTVMNIVWQIGRTGKVTPVAEIVPTRISGSVVSRITLHNLDWLRQKDVAIFDTILFEKANEIIPEVVEVITKVNLRNINQPDKCPCCSGDLIVKGAYLVCENIGCSAQNISHIRFILEKLNIKGMDETTIEKLVELDIVKEPYDIFMINADVLMCAGFGKVEATKWANSVKNVSTTPARLLACLGIPGWGETMFENLFVKSKISGHTWIESFVSDSYTATNTAYIDDMGEVRGEELIRGISKNKMLLFKLLSYVNLEKEAVGSLTGKSFCLTGTMSKGRKEIQADIKKCGGMIKDSVSKDLSYLVVGEDAGSKFNKAVGLGVSILTEDGLYKMIGK